MDLHFESPLVVPGGDEGEGHRGIARAGVYLEEMDVPKAWSIIFSAGSVPILVVKKILYIVYCIFICFSPMYICWPVLCPHMIGTGAPPVTTNLQNRCQ